MKTTLFAACLCACYIATSFAEAGEIIGRVNYPASANSRRSPAVTYLVGSAAPARSEPQTIVVDQRNREFVPRVQAAALGDSIIFRNSDDEAHNVNSQSGCCSFNYMIAPASSSGPGVSDPFVPDKAGVVRLFCNIHAQMRGFVVVCPSTLHAVADEQGTFRIKDVPEGSYKLVVWQESSQPLSRELDVTAETRLTVDLEPMEVTQGDRIATVSRRASPWRDVLRQIESKLDAAIAAASSGSAADADQLALDAYFECFEASELETAILLFRGEERKFVLERMFAKIRRPLLIDLASGKADLAAAQRAVRELTSAIDTDVAELYAKGVVDRTCMGSAVPGVTRSRSNAVGSADVSGVMNDLRLSFANVVTLVEKGESTSGAAALADSYFQIFHRIEPALAAHNYVEVRRIENRFLELRGSIRSGLASDEVRVKLDGLWSEINLAAVGLEHTTQSGVSAAANRFWNAFVILTREGVEALLIVTALLLCLERSKRPEAKRLIYGGIALALVATLITWSGLQWVIAQSGVARETIEGIAALAAGTVLFYVSYWLLSKSEARRWQQFLTRQVDRHLTSGSRWAIGLAAFLAVFREGAETILMFQPMFVRPSVREMTGAVAGIAAAILALAAIFWAMRFASVRMAIRPFFRVTGVLLFTLAVVFAGKGIAELQEARVLTISPLPVALHTTIMAIPSAIRDALGITANVQALSIQGTILAGVLLSVGSMWLLAPQSGGLQKGELIEQDGPTRQGREQFTAQPTDQESAELQPSPESELVHNLV